MILVDSITVYPSTLTIYEGQWDYDLFVRVLPENATVKSVVWSTDNSNVASVNPHTGAVYGVEAGEATITATAIDGSEKFGTCTVTVTPFISHPVESIHINQDDTSLEAGTSTTLTATVSPVCATISRVTWTSSNPEIATINENTGSVNAIKPGTTTITATACDGSEIFVTCILEVTRPTIIGYKIVNVAANKCLNIDGSDILYLENNQEVTLYSDTGTPEQKWVLDTVDDYAYIRSAVDQDYGLNIYRSNSKCDVYPVSGNEEDSQVILIGTNGHYKIQLKNHSNLFLTAEGTSDSSGVNWATNSESNNQLWDFVQISIPVPDPIPESNELSMPSILNMKYVNNYDHIIDSGCAVACCANVASYYGSRNYTFQDMIDCGVCTTTDSNANWNNVPNVKTKQISDCNYLKIIKSEIAAGRPVMIECRGTRNGEVTKHWVVAYKYTNNADNRSDVIVNDSVNSDTNDIWGSVRTLSAAMNYNHNSYINRLRLTAYKG